MRWLITFLLLILVAVGGAVLFSGDELLTALKLRPPAPPPSEAVATLDALAPDQVQRIELARPGQSTLTLIRDAAGGWTQPGDWPVREKEVDELVNTVTAVQTRYQPIAHENQLDKFGLAEADKPYTVKVDASGKTTTLVFGRATDGAAYVRVDNSDELLRIGADAFQVISRNPDEYRRRQLFPDAPRVKFIDETAVGTSVQAVPSDRVEEVRVTSPDGSYTLKRVAPNPTPRQDPDRPTGGPTVFPTQMADSWELLVGKGEGSEAARDRVDPVKLKAALTAVPELWADGFPQTTADDKQLTPEVTGLDKPERTLTLVPKNATPVTLKIGKVSRTAIRTEAAPPPPNSPFPMPTERTVTDTYHYAKFENNPLVFELKADKFADLFVKPDDLRDATLARFTADEVQSVVIVLPAKPRAGVSAVVGAAAAGVSDPTQIRLTRKKGNPFALRDEDRDDRWYVGDRLAEPGKVTELLDALNKLEAKTPADRLDEAKAESLTGYTDLDGYRVTVVAQAKVKEGDTPPPPRTYTFRFTGRNAEAKKVAVSLAGWPRVNLVDDAAFELMDRGPQTYRSRRLFDTAESTLNAVTVQKAGEPVFELKAAPKAGGDTDWRLTKPLTTDADSSKASALTGSLSRLEATEYVDDTPPPAKLTGEYGLGQPRFVLDLGFSGGAAESQKLELGAARPGKPEVYARLNGGGVFTVPQSIVDSIEKGPLDLLPLQLWSSTADKVESIGIDRGGMSYTLARAGEKWKLSGPFEATAGSADVATLVGSLASLTADRYVALQPEPGKHGLDQPTVTVRVTLAAQPPVTHTVRIGAPTGEADKPGRFAQLADGPNQAVFVIPDTLTAAADKPALGWLDRTLLDLDPTKLTRVQVQADDTVTLSKPDPSADWTADGFTPDKLVVGNLIFAAANPPVLRLAAYGPNVQWAEYGLDKPAYTVTVTTGGEKPETHTIKLGKEEPSGERYIRVDDGPAVGVVSGATGAALARGKLQLADRTLISFDPAQLTGITRKKGGEEFELSQGINWDVVKPSRFQADGPTVDELADQLSRLRAVTVAALDPKELKPYGLDNPSAEVALAVGIEKPKTVTLQLGKPVDEAKADGDRYVRVDKAGPVKVLAAAAANRLLADPIRFKDKTLAKFVDADKVTIVRGDRTATFTKVAGTWKMTAPISADAEQADLDALVNTAARLRADELVAEKSTDLKQYGLESPRAKLTFFSGSDELVSVLVGTAEGGGQRVYGKLAGGEAVVLFDPGTSDRLLAEYRKRAVWGGVDASQVQTLAVSAGNSNFAFRKAGMTWVDPANPNDPPDPAKVTDTLAALAGLKAERFVADKDADLKLYGLETPSRVIVVAQESGETKTLHLGGEVGGTNGKQVYAKVGDPGSTAVFVLSEADTTKLTRDRSGYKK